MDEDAGDGVAAVGGGNVGGNGGAKKAVGTGIERETQARGRHRVQAKPVAGSPDS